MIACLLMFAMASQSVAPIAEIPFQLTDNNSIVLEATINGKALNLLWDTGFAGCAVVDAVLDIGKPTGSMNLVDFVGVSQARTVPIKSLSLGGKQFPVTDAEAVQQSLGRTMGMDYGIHLDGLLGLEPFLDNPVEINFEHKVIKVYPRALDISKLPHDGKQVFLTKLLPEGMQALVLSVKLPSGKSMSMGLDTGNYGFLVTNIDVVGRLGCWKEDRKPQYMTASLVASGVVESFETHAGPIDIFSVPVPSSVWNVINLPAATAGSDGTVGIDFLSQFNVMFDFSRRWVRLDNFKREVASPIEGEIGIAARYLARMRSTVILNVTPQSPAAKAGIVEGDLLLGVGDDDVSTPVSPRKLRKLLSGAIGSKIRVSYSHLGAFKRVLLTRVALVNELEASAK